MIDGSEKHMRRTVLPLLILVGIAASSPAQPGAANRPADADGVPLPAGAVGRLGSTRFWHRGVIQPMTFSPGWWQLSPLGFGRTGGRVAWRAWTPLGAGSWSSTA